MFHFRTFREKTGEDEKENASFLFSFPDSPPPPRFHSIFFPFRPFSLQSDNVDVGALILCECLAGYSLFTSCTVALFCTCVSLFGRKRWRTLSEKKNDSQERTSWKRTDLETVIDKFFFASLTDADGSRKLEFGDGRLPS